LEFTSQFNQGLAPLATLRGPSGADAKSNKDPWMSVLMLRIAVRIEAIKSIAVLIAAF
jgi:hypothetical protein